MIRDNFNDLNQLDLKLDFGCFKSEVLYWGRYDGTEWWRNYMHMHSFFEICYVLSGKGVFTINGKTEEVKKGDLFIARPGEKHEIIADDKDPMAIYYWAYTLVPDNNTPKDDLHRLLTAFISSNTTICPYQVYCETILNALTFETNGKDVAYTYMVSGLVKQLIVETARASTDLSPSQEEKPAGNYKETVVKTVKHYLNDNYSQPLKLEQIAAQVHLSERHLTRIFKEVTGMRIKQYFTDIKIKMAKQLILSTSNSVFEIAYKTGFQDARHFSTVFKKQVGLSPTAFKEKGGTQFMDS